MGLKDDLETLTDSEDILWAPNVPISEISAVSYYTGTFPSNDSWRLEYNMVDRDGLGDVDSIAAFKLGQFVQSVPNCSQVLDNIESQVTTATSEEQTEFLNLIAALISPS